MKALKWILIIIILLIAAFLIISAFQPNKINVEESISIKAPPELIFDEITDFQSWDHWSAWNMQDSLLEPSYKGEPGTVGFIYSWKSDIVGSGKQEIVEIKKNKLMKTKLNFEGWDKDSYATFTLTEDDDSTTTVRWQMEGAETPFYFNLMNTLMKPAIESNYRKSLENLKEIVEAKPIPEENNQNISVVDLDAKNIIAIRDTIIPSEISTTLRDLYTKLSIFMEEKQVDASGMPLAIYYSYQPEEVILEAAFQYDGEIESSGNIIAKQLPSGKAIKGIHYGAYENSGNMHNSIEAYGNANNLQFKEFCYEVYANDPGTVDSSKIETQIYYPIVNN